MKQTFKKIFSTVFTIAILFQLVGQVPENLATSITEANFSYSQESLPLVGQARTNSKDVALLVVPTAQVANCNIELAADLTIQGSAYNWFEIDQGCLTSQVKLSVQNVFADNLPNRIAKVTSVNPLWKEVSLTVETSIIENKNSFDSKSFFGTTTGNEIISTPQSLAEKNIILISKKISYAKSLQQPYQANIQHLYDRNLILRC